MSGRNEIIEKNCVTGHVRVIRSKSTNDKKEVTVKPYLRRKKTQRNKVPWLCIICRTEHETKKEMFMELHKKNKYMFCKTCSEDKEHYDIWDEIQGEESDGSGDCGVWNVRYEDCWEPCYFKLAIPRDSHPDLNREEYLD